MEKQIVWKSIVYLFCLFESWSRIKVRAETFLIVKFNSSSE